MLFHKRIERGEKNGVQFVNGKVSFRKFALNVYCFEVDGVLIDTGSWSLKKELEGFLLNEDVDQVILTHLHEDHSGCASILEKEKNLPIFVHPMAVEECVTNPDYPLYRKVFWGKRKSFTASPIGKTFYSRNALWDVIETPGHAKDHLSFINRETGQLFSGDLFVQQKTKVILREESIPTIIRSIQHLLTYQFDEMFCSHAGFIKDGRKMLEQKRDYLLELQENVLLQFEKGLSPQQIHDQFFTRKYPISKLSFGEWDSLHIITSIINESEQVSIAGNVIKNEN